MGGVSGASVGPVERHAVPVSGFGYGLVSFNTCNTLGGEQKPMLRAGVDGPIGRVA